MFGHARADRAPDGFAGSRPASRSGVRKVGDGPYDSEDPIAERLGHGSGRIDFGSLRIPIPARAQLQVEKGNGDLLRAVHVLVPSGRVSLSALAAPRTNPLWRGLAGEIGESLSGDGARVRAEWGEWGREVEAASNGAISRFIGVDGPRWMLYGVATGPADGAQDLALVLREMMRGTVVFRGPDPLPVKTVLPLRLPEGLEERVEQAREVSREDARERTDPYPASSEGARSGAWPEVNGARPAASNGFRPAAASNASQPIPAVPPAREPMPPRRPLAGPGVPPPAHPGYPGYDAPHPGYDAPHPDSRPAAAPAIGSLGRPATGSLGRPASGLPPVPAAVPGGGFGMSAAEATWSLANPVVDAAEVAQQPAWASLSAAPSFWPHERYRPEEPPRSGEPVNGTGGYEAGRYGSGGYGTGSFETGGYGSGSGSIGSIGSFGHPPAGPSGYPVGGPSEYVPAGPPDWTVNGSGHPGDLDLSGPGDDDGVRTPLERAILAEMSFAAGSTDGVDGHGHDRPDGRPDGPEEAWTGSDSDLLSSTDGLHAVLLNDSAATRGWAARAGRRRRAD